VVHEAVGQGRVVVGHVDVGDVEADGEAAALLGVQPPAALGVDDGHVRRCGAVVGVCLGEEEQGDVELKLRLVLPGPDHQAGVAVGERGGGGEQGECECERGEAWEHVSILSVDWAAGRRGGVELT